MKRIVVNLLVGLITFAIGVSTASLRLRPQTSSALLRHHCSVAYDPARSIEKVRRADDPFLFNAFQQTPVYQLPDCVDEAYSLTWIPAFHAPVLVEVWHSSDKAFMVGKQLDRKWHLSGFPKETNIRPLTDPEWCDLVNLVDRSSYWQLPSTVDEILPQDGAVWITDCRRAKKYHWVSRRVPDEQYAQICKYLIRLSGLQTAHDLYLP